MDKKSFFRNSIRFLLMVTAFILFFLLDEEKMEAQTYYTIWGYFWGVNIAIVLDVAAECLDYEKPEDGEGVVKRSWFK